MSLIYITGVAGAGKSEVCKELRKLGYEAHEGDDGLSDFYNNESGQVVQRPAAASERTPEWRRQHTWKMSRDKLLALKGQAKTKSVFVCGVAANEEEYIDVFDKVFALEIDTETMKQRVTTRLGAGFGKSPHEIDMLLEWQDSTDEYYRKIGAHRLDATQPISAVVSQIVASV